jgi:ABC-type transport system involved in Fe-S cluster assembly fused permease/ATPase subunit
VSNVEDTETRVVFHFLHLHTKLFFSCCLFVVVAFSSWKKLIKLFQVYREIRQALVDMETLVGLRAVKSTIVEQPDAKELQLSKGDITFKDVSFSFHERLILNKAVRRKKQHNLF